MTEPIVGKKVKVVQTVSRRDGDWVREVVGTVTASFDTTTGSWYAHAKDGRYWLRRLQIEKADGEQTVVSLTEKDQLQVLEDESSR